MIHHQRSDWGESDGGMLRVNLWYEMCEINDRYVWMHW